jgi:hypothetical protein
MNKKMRVPLAKKSAKKSAVSVWNIKAMTARTK